MPKRKPLPPPASNTRWFVKFEFSADHMAELGRILSRAKVADVNKAIEDLRRAAEKYTATLPLQQQLGTPAETRDRLARIAEQARALAAELQAADARAGGLLKSEWMLRHPGQVIDLHDAAMNLIDLAAMAELAAGKIKVRKGRAVETHSHAELIAMIEKALAPHGIALAEGGPFLAIAGEIFAAADLGSSSPKDGISALRKLREELNRSA